MLALALGLLGLIVGPFLGIVIDRAVEREQPALEHRCQHCGQSLGSRSLLPVVNWFLRCPTDRDHPRWRYPLTDLATAISFAVAGERFGVTFELAPYVVFFAALVAMSVIDVETHLLLNVLTYPSLLGGLVAVLVLSGSNGAEARIWPALTGAALYFGILAAAYLAYPPGLGLGDVKLAPTLGLFLGWLTTEKLEAAQLVFYSLLLGFLVAGVGGLLVNLWRRDRSAEVAMGPYLAAATVVMIAVGPVGTAVAPG